MNAEIGKDGLNPVKDNVSAEDSTGTSAAGVTDETEKTSNCLEPPEEQQEQPAAQLDELTALRQERAVKTVEAESYFNRLQRLQADFENFRRRSRREQEELVKYASEGLITDLLPVIDNLERALAAGSRGGDLTAFLDGLQMIYRQMWGVLEKQELAPIEAVGQVFNPERHHAVMQVATGEYAENTVVEELQKGYCLKDRVIRPALVKVARPEQQ